MKALKFIFIAIFILALCYPVKSWAQKRAEKVQTTITLKSNNGTVYQFTASGNQVFSPGGNIVKTVKIKVDKDHQLMQEFGIYPNKLFEISWLYYDYNENGEYDEVDGDIELTDAIAKLNRSGNLSITFHMNGAGTYLPLGW